MSSESTLWLDQLTSADPLVFPLVFVTASLINLQMHAIKKTTIPQTKIQKVIPWVFRGGILGVGVFGLFVPAAVSMYWATSSVAGVAQNVVLKIPRVRRFFKIPLSLSHQ